MTDNTPRTPERQAQIDFKNKLRVNPSRALNGTPFMPAFLHLLPCNARRPRFTLIREYCETYRSLQHVVKLMGWSVPE